MSVKISLLHTTPRQEVVLAAGTTLRAVKRLIRSHYGGSGEGTFYQQSNDDKIPPKWKYFPAGSYYFMDVSYNMSTDIEMQTPVYGFDEEVTVPGELEKKTHPLHFCVYYIKRLLVVNILIAAILAIINVEWKSKVVEYILIGQTVLETALGGTLAYITEGSWWGRSENRVLPSN